MQSIRIPEIVGGEICEVGVQGGGPVIGKHIFDSRSSGRSRGDQVDSAMFHPSQEWICVFGGAWKRIPG